MRGRFIEWTRRGEKRVLRHMIDLCTATLIISVLAAAHPGRRVLRVPPFQRLHFEELAATLGLEIDVTNADSGN